MKGFKRQNQLFSLCGLNCGLCPMFLNKNCPGCGGGEGNQACKIARCSMEHGDSWGQRVIRFYDLDGHIVEVGEDMKMVLKRFLASGMTMEEISVKMDASVEDLTKLMNS